MCKKFQLALLDRVKLCKQEMGISYKKMYESAEIKRSTFYNFTGGIRELTEPQAERLQNYLKNLGY